MEVIQDNVVTFRDLGLSENTLEAVEAKGFVTPSPIQVACIPILLRDEKDIIGRAQIGTEKRQPSDCPHRLVG